MKTSLYRCAAVSLALVVTVAACSSTASPRAASDTTPSIAPASAPAPSSPATDATTTTSTTKPATTKTTTTTTIPTTTTTTLVIANDGSVPDADPTTAAPTSTSEATTTTVHQCVPGQDLVPAGHYKGTVKGTITETENAPGTGSIPLTFDNGEIDVYSDGNTLSGVVSMHWYGKGNISFGGGPTFEIINDDQLKGTLSGPVENPSLDGTVDGTEVVDGDPQQGTRDVHLHLAPSENPSCDYVLFLVRDMLQESSPGNLVTYTGLAGFVAKRQPN